MSQTASRRIGFFFLNLGHAYDHLFMLLFATVVLGLEDAFERPYGELLTLSVPGFIAFAAGTLPAGWLGDRWSRSGMIAVFFIGIGASSILTGFARTPTEIAGGLTLIGLFASIYHPIGISMVVEGRAKVGKLLGINGVYGNLGVAAAALIAAGLMQWIDWRAAFILPGIVAALTGVAYVVYLRLRPKPDWAEKVAPGEAAAAHPPSSRYAMRRIIAVIAVSTMLGGLVYQGTVIALPKLFDERLGWFDDSIVGVGLMVSLVIAVAAFSQIFIGHLVDRKPIKYVWIATLLAQVPFLAVIAMTSGTGLLVTAFAMMFMMVGEVPIADTLVARYSDESWRSRIYGVKFLFGLGTGALAAPLVALLHGSGGGFVWLFAIFAALTLIIGVAVFWLPGRAPKAEAALREA